MGRKSVKGLATVAMLKANFDSGKDHIEMFLPFVLDAIQSHPTGDFSLEDVKSRVEARHSLLIPSSSLRTILARAVKRGALRREGGRYFRGVGFPSAPDLTAQRAATEAEQRRLASALVEFGRENGFSLASEEDALALLLEFLLHYHVSLILDSAAPPSAPDLAIGSWVGPSSRELRLVARFVTAHATRDSVVLGVLQRMLEGFVLQNALLLRDINEATRRFTNLSVYFDTGFLLEALGLEGEAAGLAARETVALLRETGAEVCVFDKTVMEIKRILWVYEEKLRSAQGIASLYPTELTRYVLTHKLKPSDISEIVSLLDTNLRALGLAIRKTPTRHPRYTLDEKGLTQVIKRPTDADSHPRVVHDVDCIAAVLTLRAGHTSISYDDARAVFATTTGLLVTHVREWYQASGEAGVRPVIHQLALSNIAWLKRPASASKLKLHELVALCTAALAPSKKVWDQFSGHLRTLQESGRLSSEEMVAIVTSQLTDDLLSRFDEDVDTDADTIEEVIERVREQYKVDAQRSIQDAEARAKRREEELRELVLRLRRRSRRLARWVSWSIFLVLAGLAVTGSSVPVVEFLQSRSVVGQVLGYLISGSVWLLGIVGLLWGGYLFQWQRSLEDRLERYFRASLLGDVKEQRLLEP